MYGTAFPTPVSEWVLVIYHLNFFAIIAFANTFYDSVHDIEDLQVREVISNQPT